jgi:hypothetical protein
VSIGGSILLIAIGAILRFAIETDRTIGSTTVEWGTVGVILMVAGALGLIVSLIMMQMSTRRQTTVERYDADPR